MRSAATSSVDSRGMSKHAFPLKWEPERETGRFGRTKKRIVIAVRGRKCSGFSGHVLGFPPSCASIGKIVQIVAETAWILLSRGVLGFYFTIGNG